MQGKQSIGPLVVTTPDGGTVTFGSLTGNGFAIDPARVSLAVFSELMAAVSANPQPRSPAEHAATAQMIGKLYQGFAIDRFEMRDMEVKPAATTPSGNVRVGAFVMSGLKNGQIGTFGIEGLTGEMPSFAQGKPTTTPFKMGKFAINGLDIAGMLLWSATLQGAAGASQPNLAMFLQLIKSVELHDTAIPDPQKGTTTKIESAKISWDRFVAGGLPADIRQIGRAHV